YYLAAAERWANEARGPQRAESSKQLAIERDNLLAIVERALVAPRGGAETALRGLVAIEPVQRARAPSPPYIELLDRALARAEEDGTNGTLVARALLARAGAHRAVGQTKRARADAEKAVASTEAIGDTRTLASALASLADL